MWPCDDPRCPVCRPARARARERAARMRRRDFVVGLAVLSAFVVFLALMEGVTSWVFS